MQRGLEEVCACVCVFVSLAVRMNVGACDWESNTERVNEREKENSVLAASGFFCISPRHGKSQEKGKKIG